MSYKFVITNPTGATLRIAPNSGAGTIRPVKAGSNFDIERLIFVTPQTFDADSIPQFVEAEKQMLVRGDVWVQVKGLQAYKAETVTGYVALRFLNSTYGVVVGEPDAIPQGEREARVAEIDEMFRLLAMRRAELTR